MFKINDVVYIYNLNERTDGHHAKEGDICIILDVFEGGTDPWSGRDEEENYKVLNERTGETIYLNWTTSLKLYDKPYTRKSSNELEEARKQSWKEWLEEEKKEIEEREGLYGTDEITRELLYEIQELEEGYKNEKYTEKYFNKKIKSLIYAFNSCSHKMSKGQLEFRDMIWNKYYNLL